MKAQLAAVQMLFFLLLLCSIAAAGAAAPLDDDGRLTRTLDELVRFKQGFDRKQLERFLFERAASQGQVALAEVARPVQEGAKLRARTEEGAPAVLPLAHVDLGTIAAVNAFCGAQGSVRVGSPQPAAIAGSLLWRLARRGVEGAYTLQGVELVPGPASQADIELEQQVIAARQAVRQREKELASAVQKHELLDARLIIMRKRRASWRPMMEAQQKRDQARADMEAKQKELEDARARYEELARKAESFSAPASPGADGFGGAVASLLPPDGKAVFKLSLPVALQMQNIPVPGLKNCDFAVAKASGLWDAIANKSAPQAIADLERRFSWHYRTAGRAVLQLSPLLPLCLLLLLLFRMRKAAGSYNPFDKTQVLADLPRVGLKPPSLNLVVTVLLPLTACTLSIWSLLRIDAMPAVPLFSALVILALGAVCTVRLGELGSLRDAVTRSHKAD